MGARPFVVLVLLGLTFAFAACGDDDSTTEGGAGATAAETAPETTEPAETNEAETTESEPAPSGEAAAAEKVRIVEFTYQPDPVVVRVGGKVTWQNEDTAPHTATADDGSFDTGTIDKGKIGSETFKEAGTYPYFCEIHPDMRGTVEVVE